MIALDLGNLLVHLNLNDTTFVAGIRRTETKLQSLSSRLDTIGTKISTRLTAPLTLFSGLAVRNATTLENAFAGVVKTVDATQEQLEGLRQGFNNLARGPISSSVQELYGLGEAAGQLGINVENIVDFSKTMADLGVSTNLTSQEAAIAFAQMANVMQMPQEQIENLASSLVYLGNTSATNEKRILDMAQRIAAAGSIASLSSADVLGLAGAFSSLGLRSEAGGTAVTKILIDMTNAVRGQTEELRTFARVAGVSVKEFSRQFQESGALALTSFIEGLARLDAEGSNVVQILDNLGLEGVRVTQALLSAGNAGDLVRLSLQRSSAAFQQNTALAEEAAKRYVTLGSRFRQLRNEISLGFERIGVIIGEHLLSIGNTVLVPFLRWFSGLNESTQRWAVSLTLITAALGPLTLGLSALLKVTTSILSVYAGLITASFSWIGVSLLLAGAAYTLYAAWVQNITAIKDRMEEWANALGDTFEWLQNTALAQFLTGMVKGFAEVFRIIRTGWRDFIADLGSSIIASTAWFSQMKRALEEAWSAPTVDSMIMRFRVGMKKAQEEFAQSFVANWDSTRSGVDDMANFTVEQYKTTILSLKALGEGTVEHLEVLLAALKTQFASDFESIVSRLKDALPDLAGEIDKTVEKLNETNQSTIELNNNVDELIKKFGEFPNVAEQISKGFKEAREEIEDSFSSWGQRAKDITLAVEQNFRAGLGNMSRDLGNWKDYVLQTFEEIYYQSLQIAFLDPLAKAGANVFSKIGQATFSALGGVFSGGSLFSGGSAPVGLAHSGALLGKTNLPQVMAPIAAYTSAPSFGSGGKGEMAIWAHQNEHILTPEQMNYLVGAAGKEGSGISSIRLINESGTPLQITRREEYLLSDQRILDVVLAAQSFDGTYRRSQKRMNR